MATWTRKYSLRLADLTKPVLKDLNARLRERVDGAGDLGHWASRRNAIQARASLNRAVAAGLLYECKWPEPEDSERNLKSNQPDQDWEDRIILNRADAMAVLDGLLTRRREGYRTQCMTALGFLCGLRPSETAELRVADFHLPHEGWGTVKVKRAHIGAIGERYDGPEGEVGAPKTRRSRRTVPLPPVMVAMVRAWMERSGITKGPLFYTAGGKAVTSSNWCRALASACENAGVERIVPYDARHYFASHSSKGRVDQAQLAALMGTSVEVLNRYYIHLTSGADERVRELLGAALGV